MKFSAWDLATGGLVVIGLISALLRRRLDGRLGVSLFIGCISVATGLIAVRLGWPLAELVPRLVRICAALSAIWAVCGWATCVDAPLADDDKPSTASCFFAGALATAVASTVLLVYLIAIAILARLLEPSYPLAQASQHGPTDILTLGAALGFWRLARHDRVQPTLMLVLAGLLAIHVGLMIPGSVIGSEDEGIRSGASSPAWWTLVMELGLAGVLVGSTAIRDRSYRIRRDQAWPDDLDALLLEYPRWPGYSELYSLIGAAGLVLAVYHVIRPRALEGVGGACSVMASVGAGIACLYTNYRRWNPNLAGLGLALLTAATVTLASMTTTEGSVDAARFLPVRLNAVIFGLCLAALVLFCLSDFWTQQLLDAGAWTTTGRLIPHCWRAGFLITALAVLAAFQLALWPGGRLTLVRDDTVGRWLAGEAGLLFLMFTAGWSAMRRHRIETADGVLTERLRDPGLAMLTVATLVAAVLFAVVRWPPNDTRGWAIQHVSVLLAIGSLPVLAVAEALPRTRAGVFAPPLWFLALLAMPAIAMFYCAGRPVTEWLRPLTFAALACTYALAAAREGRRAFLVLSVVLLAAAAWTVAGMYRAAA